MTSAHEITADAITLRVSLTPTRILVGGQLITMAELGIPLPFACKAASLNDFACGKPQRVFVHAHKELTALEFDDFAGRLMRERDWLTDESHAVPLEDAHTCLMVSAPGRPVLFVDTQGYSYARYVARLG